MRADGLRRQGQRCATAFCVAARQDGGWSVNGLKPVRLRGRKALTRHALQDGKLAGMAIERKGLIDSRNLVLTEPQLARSGVLRRMLGCGRLGDGKEWRPPYQERKRDLTQCRAMRVRDLR